MKTNAILAIILAVGLIGFSVFTINNYNKGTAKPTSKIIVDILGVVFIIGAVAGIWRAFKALTT